LDASVVAGLGLATIHAEDSRFVDTDDSVHEIEVGKDEGNLLRRPEAREETELVVPDMLPAAR
jgi:hypothetical protein